MEPISDARVTELIAWIERSIFEDIDSQCEVIDCLLELKMLRRKYGRAIGDAS